MPGSFCRVGASLLALSVVLAVGEAAWGAVQIQPVLQGLSSPVYFTQIRDGSHRFFVVEQGGVIRVLQPGPTTPTVFLDIHTRVLSGGERGLLGLAFHPQYVSNGFFYVHYTNLNGDVVIARYHVSSNPNVADPNSELILLTVPHPTFGNHNGGMVEFGPDGKLYIGVGDGGSGNDPPNNAQNLGRLLGKILRLDVDAPAPYVPGDNPFGNQIWAYGLRNPFRFSFDRATGQLYVGDVGQDAFEEIDVITKGANYGWRVFEGFHCTGNDPGLCGQPGFIPPIAEYDHSAGRCAIIGGYVYRGQAGTFPAGSYVYGDSCTGEIFLLQNGVQSVLLDTTLLISSFGEDESGEIYVVGLGGTVHRLSSVFSGGVFVAADDLDKDGKADIITGAGPGGGPHVRVFSGADPTVVLASFFAYNPAFTGGVRVAAGDFNGDGHADIVTAAGPGGGPHVQVFDRVTLQVLRSFFAYSAAFTSGVYVAVGSRPAQGGAEWRTLCAAAGERDAAAAGRGPARQEVGHLEVVEGILGQGGVRETAGAPRAHALFADEAAVRPDH